MLSSMSQNMEHMKTNENESHIEAITVNRPRFFFESIGGLGGKNPSRWAIAKVGAEILVENRHVLTKQEVVFLLRETANEIENDKFQIPIE